MLFNKPLHFDKSKEAKDPIKGPSDSLLKTRNQKPRVTEMNGYTLYLVTIFYLGKHLLHVWLSACFLEESEAYPQNKETALSETILSFIYDSHGEGRKNIKKENGRAAIFFLFFPPFFLIILAQCSVSSRFLWYSVKDKCDLVSLLGFK